MWCIPGRAASTRGKARKTAMTTRDLIEKLLTVDPQLQVMVWDSKANRFADHFALSATLFDELLITPVGAAEARASDFMPRPVPAGQMHFPIH